MSSGRINPRSIRDESFKEMRCFNVRYTLYCNTFREVIETWLIGNILIDAHLSVPRHHWGCLCLGSSWPPMLTLDLQGPSLLVVHLPWLNTKKTRLNKWATYNKSSAIKKTIGNEKCTYVSTIFFNINVVSNYYQLQPIYKIYHYLNDWIYQIMKPSKQELKAEGRCCWRHLAVLHLRLELIPWDQCTSWPQTLTDSARLWQSAV